MRTGEMDRWAQHCGWYFQQDPSRDCVVLHPVNRQKFHIDLLLFSPNARHPFWKLCTMGASDYKLPLTFCQRNEFVMFIHEEEDLRDKELLSWYCDVLISVALYPAENHMALTFGHSIVWGEKPGTDMTAAFLELPYPIDSPGFFTCRLRMGKEAHCLQVILLTKEETDLLIRGGPQKISEYLYPQEGPGHFLSERYRSAHF